MKISEQIDMQKLVMELYHDDLYKLNNQSFYRLDDISLLELKEVVITNDINAVLLILDRLMKKASEEMNADHIIFLSYFLYRYIYFFRTIGDWNRYVTEHDEVPISDAPTMFLNGVAPFFNDQIDFFIGNYENYLEELKIKTISQKLYDTITHKIANINNSISFDTKLAFVEELVLYFQDSKNLTGLLEGENDDRKETFLTLTNEIKIDFQSMNNLISLVLLKIKGLKVE